MSTPCVIDKCKRKPKCEHACDLRVQPAASILDARDAEAKPHLLRIGQAIGFGNAQHILGQQWDEMLTAAYGISGRGAMGVTANEREAYKRGWDACMAEWAKHMERVAKALKRGAV